MELSSILSEGQIVLDMKSVDHIPAIEELVEQLDTLGLLTGENKEDVLDALKIREDQISTAIGSGVAIPHAFSDKIEDVLVVFGRSKEGIEFEALDNAPVKSILLLVVPENKKMQHLQTLSQLAKFFTKCEVRQALEAAETREEVLAVFQTGCNPCD